MLVITVGLLLAVLFKQGAFALVGIVGLIVVIVGSKTFAKGLANEVPAPQGEAARSSSSGTGGAA